MSTTAWIVLGIIALLVIWVIILYNGLVAMRQRVNQAFADVDVQLKQRHDLVPNLVETVKGYAAHEDKLFRDLAELRAKSISGGSVTEQSQVSQAMTGMLGRLFAIAEAYPELKADANFRDLQDKLAGVEDEIQLSRRYYNGAVRNFNTMIESFPTNIISGFFQFTKAEFFEIGDQAARQVPKVEFNKAS
jgi:LemA protein